MEVLTLVTGGLILLVGVIILGLVALYNIALSILKIGIVLIGAWILAYGISMVLFNSFKCIMRTFKYQD